MKVFKRIVTQILAFVTCISLCVCTVFAEWYNDLAYRYTQSNLAQWAVHSLVSIGAGAAGFAAGTVYCPGFGSISGTALGEFGANLLNGGIDALMADLAKDSSFVSEDEYIDSLDTPTVKMTDTSMTFTFSLSPESQKDVNEYLEKGYYLDFQNSGGSVFYTIGKSCSSSYGNYYFDAVELTFYSSVFTIASSGNYSIDCSSYTGFGRYLSNSMNNSSWFFPVAIQKYVDGSWSSIDGPSYYGSSKETSHSSDEYFGSVRTSPSCSDSIYLASGYSYRFICSSRYSDFFGDSSVYATGFRRGLQLPTVTLSSEKAVLSAPLTTRPTYITNAITNYNSENNEYNYFIGKVDNSNNVFNVNIFDETTNEFRDPYTDKPYQVTNWVYDYAQRLYVLTLADDTLLYNGKPIKNLVIWYADNALYYIGLDDSYTDGSDWTDHIVFTDAFQYVIAQKKDSSGTGADGHKHVFTSETTTPPSCTGTGVRTYSCQFCDYSYDEIIPAAGHQWEVTEVKDTEFNDNGDVTAAGYTFYTCAVCGETYKQWSNTGQPGPPTGNTGTGSGGGSSGSGSGSGSSGSSGPSFWDKLKDSVLGLLADLIDAVFGLISDVLSAVLGLVKDLLSFLFGFLSDTVIKGITDLFSAFGSIKLELPEGVASVFGFFSGVILALPAEIRSLLIFGVAALFLISIFKMVKA